MQHGKTLLRCGYKFQRSREKRQVEWLNYAFRAKVVLKLCPNRTANIAWGARGKMYDKMSIHNCILFG